MSRPLWRARWHFVQRSQWPQGLFEQEPLKNKNENDDLASTLPIIPKDIPG